MAANQAVSLPESSSAFRSLAELLLPIAEEHDAFAVSSLPAMPHEPLASCLEKSMPMDSVTSNSRDVVGTITGQLEPSPHAQEAPSREEAVLHDIEAFRIYAIETIERSLERLLLSIAEEVLGRDLLLAPADVNEIARRALRRYDREGPLRVRVSANDLSTVQTELPVVVDPELQAGDLIVEVRDGLLDARMGVRLDCIIRRFLSDASAQ